MKNLSKLEMAGLAFLSILTIYMLACGLGITNTFWGWDSRHSGWLWKIVMLAIVGSVAYVIYQVATGEMELKGAGWFGLIIALGIGFAASTGFKFTGGDIKQSVTYLDNLGKVSDKDLLFNCYDDFYKFSTNPELKAYVLKYDELPGRNRWNTYILSGDAPKSTAPRADEDFQWHTGAYEMDLKNKDCR